MSSKKLGWVLLAGLAGCVTGGPPPKQLLEARHAYEELIRSPTAATDSRGVAEAREALRIAEWASNNNSASEEARDKAYLALRKIQTVQARGTTREWLAKKGQAERELEIAGQARASTEATSEAEATRRRMEGELETVQQQLERERAELERERQARLDAEARNQEAMNQLSQIANVKKEARGLVITLSGSVLFPSGKSTLLPEAQERLAQVAEALRNTETPSITVEGHTDSRGSAALNESLSVRRAEVVRRFLAERGVPDDKMRTLGWGPERPVADNTSAEGRANNRRVEIVLAPMPQRQTTGSSSTAVPSEGTSVPTSQPLQDNNTNEPGRNRVNP